MVSECRITDSYHNGEVPGLIVLLLGWVDPSNNFSGSGAVVLCGFGVRCGRVKVVSSSLGYAWGVGAELRMPTHDEEGTWANRSLTRLERPLP